MVVSFRPFTLLLFLAIVSPARLSAQSSNVPSSGAQSSGVQSSSAQSSSEESVERAPLLEELAPIGVPTDKDKQKETDSRLNSLVDGIFAKPNRMGLAVGLTEFYTPNTVTNGPKSSAGSFTSANSSFYANFVRTKSQFHIDYTIGYQRDNRQSLSGVNQTGSLSWSRLMGRRGSLNISESFIDSPNDYSTTSRLTDPFQSPYVSTQEIFVDRQRITRNVLTVSSGYQVGKRTTVDVFASHELSLYQRADFGQTQILQAGVGAAHQLNKFLFISTSYTGFINNVDPMYRDVAIQRLRVITLRFHRRGINVSSSAGVEYANNHGSNDVVAEAEAGMTMGSRSNAFSLQYLHGLTSIVGAGTAVVTDSLYASLMHRISNRFSLGLSSSYMHYGNKNGLQKSGLDSLEAGARIQLALTHDVILSGNLYYVSQTTRNLGFYAPELHRSAGSASITYILPAFRVR